MKHTYTENKLQELLGARKMQGSYRESLKRITCKDGESISVQANQFTYCSPRDDNGPWCQVECGFPSVSPNTEMMPYCENADKPTETVYGYVPLSIVAQFLDEHGGIAE